MICGKLLIMWVAWTSLLINKQAVKADSVCDEERFVFVISWSDDEAVLVCASTVCQQSVFQNISPTKSVNQGSVVQSSVFCVAAKLKEGWWKKRCGYPCHSKQSSALDWFLTKTRTANIIHWSELSASLHMPRKIASSKTTSHLLSLSVMLFTPLKLLLYTYRLVPNFFCV